MTRAMVCFTNLSIHLLCLLAIRAHLTQAQELLENEGFEHGLTSWSKCFGFQCTTVPAEESRFGSQSFRATGRTEKFHGAAQDIQTHPDGVYTAKAWIKLLNDLPGKLWQTVVLELVFEHPDHNKEYTNVAEWHFVNTSNGWIELVGNFQAPETAVTKTSFRVQGPDPGVDFLLDLASVTEMTPDSNWRNQSDANIDTLRKSDIELRVTLANGIDASDVEIQVFQTRKSFPFGTKVGTKLYVEPSAQKYRDFLHQHFNWAVTGLMLKWRQMEKHEGDLVYDIPLESVRGLRTHGIQVRGHNIVWSVERFIPDWVRAKSGQELRNIVIKRFRDVCNVTRGLLAHWDVNNELLHGQWFQERLHDSDYDLELFRLAHQYCPGVKLFLNDYNVVARGSSTTAYLAQAKRFLEAHVHLYGIGVQSHFRENQSPSPTLLKARLDLLAQAGVPIWVTELTCSFEDEVKRAACYETALRVYYAHPAVHGILMWGVWDGDHNLGTKASLAQGDNVELTEAGHRVLDLYENEWMTDDTRTLSQAGDQFTVRGFHGDYEVRVRYQGNELANLTKTFTLAETPKIINLNVHV